jgi:signal transduction histidine kinase
MEYLYTLQKAVQDKLGTANDTDNLILLFLTIAVIAILTVGIYWYRLRKNELLKYEFITIMAHKFRTPLTQIRWLAEMIISGEQDPLKKENLKQILKSNQKLIDLTGTLIELTEKNDSNSSYVFVRQPFCSFVRNIADSLKNMFHEKNIFLSIQCPEEEIFARLDIERMGTVLQAILENACIYSPPGMNVNIFVSRSYRKITISVTDQGIGIAPDEIPKIFSKFYRAQKAQTMDTEGFGIGLFLARSIVRRHKGKIEVFSDGIGKGSTFTITIPRVK